MSAIPLPEVRRARLSNGLTVLVAPRPGVPLAAVRLLVRAGSSLNPAGRFGLAHMVALAMRRGTARRSATRIDQEIEALGAELGTGVDEDAAGAGLSAPLEALPRLVEVLADVALRPTFPRAEVEQLRKRELAALGHDLDEPGVVADRATLGVAYGRHPYGHPSEGKGRHLAEVRRADLAGFHARHWRPSRSTVLVVGPVDPEATVALVERRFGGWRDAPGAVLEIAPPAPPDGPAVLIVDSPELTQAQLRVVSGGFARAHPDHTTALVAGAVLGGGFTSRLMEAVRVNRGLTYGIRSRFSCSRSGGIFHLSSFTKVESAGQLVRVALDEVVRFRDEGPTAEELERTAAWLCGLHPLGLETHDQWAERLAEVELYGLPAETISAFPERVRAVTVAGCHEVARRWLPSERRVVVAVGPAKVLRPQLEPFGAVRVVAARTVI